MILPGQTGQQTDKQTDKRIDRQTNRPMTGDKTYRLNQRASRRRRIAWFGKFGYYLDNWLGDSASWGFEPATPVVGSATQMKDKTELLVST